MSYSPKAPKPLFRAQITLVQTQELRKTKQNKQTKNYTVGFCSSNNPSGLCEQYQIIYQSTAQSQVVVWRQATQSGTSCTTVCNAGI